MLPDTSQLKQLPTQFRVHINHGISPSHEALHQHAHLLPDDCQMLFHRLLQCRVHVLLRCFQVHPLRQRRHACGKRNALAGHQQNVHLSYPTEAVLVCRFSRSHPAQHGSNIQDVGCVTALTINVSCQRRANDKRRHGPAGPPGRPPFWKRAASTSSAVANMLVTGGCRKPSSDSLKNASSSSSCTRGAHF